MRKFLCCGLCLMAVLVSSCSSSFLDNEPAGDYVRQDQYDQMKNTLEGSMRGIYSKLYSYSGHDAFGERAIDMYGDILCGDMAVTQRLYGYFYCDENGESNTDRADYLWNYYYSLLHNLNMVISEANKQAGVMTRLKAGEDLSAFSQEDAVTATYCAEALTMRGYVLMRLRHFFAPSNDVLTPTMALFPLYPYTSEEENLPRATAAEVDADIEANLQAAILLFDAFSDKRPRTDKLTVDGTLARVILAYAYLNKAKPGDAELYEQALLLAEQVIKSGEYRIMPRNIVLTTGFNDINEASWMWGQDVTSETATLLGSFFGQVDIHTYSYAWAGETKVCDKNLYDAIPAWDIRKRWFNDGKANSTYTLCPDGKFFSAKCPNSTASEDIDRTYLSDNVFLRVEMVYLMAAEAACRVHDYDKAKLYLTAITDQRVADEEAYAAWKSALSSSNLLAEIGYNWRVELWGEGFGLQTFRRLTKEMRRGANHLCRPGALETPADDTYKIQIPSNEYVYNPNI